MSFKKGHKPFISKTHGMTNTDTYKTWTALRTRCKGKSYYKHYAKKGVTCDASWDKFENFLKDMGEKPKGSYLDRIDNNGNYTKENCRWTSASHNAANKLSCGSKNGTRGVYKKLNRYIAMITINKKLKQIGSFKTVFEATYAYCEAYKSIYGELPPDYKDKDFIKGKCKDCAYKGSCAIVQRFASFATASDDSYCSEFEPITPIKEGDR